MNFLTWLYLVTIVNPVVMLADWYGTNHVGETGVEFDDDFDGDVEFIEEYPLKKFDDTEEYNGIL